MEQVFWRSVLLLYVNCWYFIAFLKTCTNHCLSTIFKPFHSNHVIGILKIDITFFNNFIFFHNSHIFPVTSNCTKAVYIPVLKSFLTNVGELKKVVKIKHTVCIYLRQIQNNCFPKPKLFFPFCQDKDQTHKDILFCCSIDTTTFSCTAYKTFVTVSSPLFCRGGGGGEGGWKIFIGKRGGLVLFEFLGGVSKMGRVDFFRGIWGFLKVIFIC